MNKLSGIGIHRTGDPFTRQMFLSLWRPALLSSLGWALSDMMDAIVVGQRLGSVGLASISLILPIYMVNCMLIHGLGLGGSIHYSRLSGEGKTQEAVNSFRGVLLLSMIFGVAMAILGNIFIDPLLSLLGTKKVDGALYKGTKDYLQVLLASTPLFYLSNLLNYYLRNDENQHLAGIGSVTGNICDILFNILLVLVLNLGTRGAALSTTLGQVIAVAIYLPGFFSNKHTLRFGLPKGRWLVPALSSLKAGMATSVQYLYQMIFLLVCNNLLILLGGESAVAVFDVLQNTSYLILYLFDGVGRAMQPIVSTYQGEHNRQGKFHALQLGFVAGFLSGGMMILLVGLWPTGICWLFGIAGSPTEAMTRIALRLYSVSAIFAGINILICTYYQACENDKPSFILETLRGIAVLIPLTFLCFKFGQLDYFWLLFLMTEAVSLILFLLLGVFGLYKKDDFPAERIFQRMIPSSTKDIMGICQDLENFCKSWGANDKQRMMATMVIEEVGMVILKHGFHDRSDGYVQITVVMEKDDTLSFHLRDNATTFNPFDMETKRASKNEAFDMDSMGILIIKNQAKDFFYRRYHGFNTLTVRL